MKSALASVILLALSAVDAKKHRLCCCIGIDEDAPGTWSDKRPTCLKKPNEGIVEASQYKFITNTATWNYNYDKKVPVAGDSKYWFYAADTPYNDNWVGGDEAANLCGERNYLSKCFSPAVQAWRNPTTSKRSQNINTKGEVVDMTQDFSASKRSQNINTKGEVVDLTQDFSVAERDVMERDIMERKANGTKSTKHHGHKNSTSSHHGKKKNSTSTKPHSKHPKSTAPPTHIADLLQRDALDPREATLTIIPRGRKNTTTTSKPKTHHSKTSASGKPHKTPVSGKPLTTFLHVTKSAGHPYYGNGTSPGFTTPTAGAGTGTGTASVPKATGAGGVVYCNQYWKAPGCVDQPDPAVKPVVCGQYWKAKGCVPASK